MTKRPFYGPIPWTAIKKMAEVRGYDLDEFTHCVREMDAIVLTHANADPDAPKVNRSRTFGPDLLSR